MATYQFETITAAEALFITAADVVLFNGAPSTSIDVLYGADRLTVVFAGRIVEFGAALGAASVAGNLQFADGSKLFIGDGSANVTSFANTTTIAAMFGGDGSDTLIGGLAETFVHGNAGNDTIEMRFHRNGAYGGKGDDRITIGSMAPDEFGNWTQPGSFAHGNMGADTILGGSGADTLLGGQDNDSISGGYGADYISGDLGNDRIDGSISGGHAYGGPGRDTIYGGSGPGDHYVNGGDGDDYLIAVAGNNTLVAGAGTDSLQSYSPGRDMIVGGDGVTWIFTRGGGGDQIFGGGEDDVLHSETGGDTLWGGSGRDNFMGSEGKNILYGEGDGDFFRLTPKDISTPALLEEVRDWTISDKLNFAANSYARPFLVGHDAYAERTAATYADALAVANGLMQGGPYDCVAVQTGADVVVFADIIGGDDRADAAIILTGVTLETISSATLVWEGAL